MHLKEENPYKIKNILDNSRQVKSPWVVPISFLPGAAAPAQPQSPPRCVWSHEGDVVAVSIPPTPRGQKGGCAEFQPPRVEFSTGFAQSSLLSVLPQGRVGSISSCLTPQKTDWQVPSSPGDKLCQGFMFGATSG